MANNKPNFGFGYPSPSDSKSLSVLASIHASTFDSIDNRSQPSVARRRVAVALGR